ncbi:hypothetical protein Leryth_012785 [Lithospermum erythrorhizon]|nr:hypothetical protein Leryth_012785 [Lithospermum erythrorhizon]
MKNNPTIIVMVDPTFRTPTDTKQSEAGDTVPDFGKIERAANAGLLDSQFQIKKSNIK